LKLVEPFSVTLVFLVMVLIWRFPSIDSLKVVKICRLIEINGSVKY